MPRFAAGPWMPDLPALGNPGLVVAKNCLPRGAGYEPMKSLTTMSLGSLDAYCRGGIAGFDYAGLPFNHAGDQTKLYRTSGSSIVNVSKSGGYSLGDSDRWEFAQFSRNILAVAPNHDLQYFDLQSSTLYADATPSSPKAPRARHIGLVGSHIVLGNIYSETLGELPDAVQWCAQNAPLSWPTPGTDLATSTQADYNQLEGNGGWINAVLSGAEVGIVLQERAIWRMDYIGGPAIYQFTRVEPERGLLIPGLATAISRGVFYYSEEGFFLCDYTASKPIGEDRVNDFFKEDLNNSYVDRVSCLPYPGKPLICVGYPSNESSSGVPDRILLWNYVANRWGLLEVDHERLLPTLTPGDHLDSDPQDENLDTYEPTSSFDDRISGVGARAFGGYGTSHELANFSGTELAATLEGPDLELNPGGRAKVHGVIPFVEGGDAAVQVGTKAKVKDSISWRRESGQTRSGVCPVRAEGAFHRVRILIPAGGFDQAVGYEVLAQAAGRR